MKCLIKNLLEQLSVDFNNLWLRLLLNKSDSFFCHFIIFPYLKILPYAVEMCILSP